MATVIDQADNPEEKSSLVLEITLKDTESNVIGTPNSVSWSLMDEDGDIINARENVAVTPALGQFDIFLKEDDLAITQANGQVRKLLIEFSYSSTYDSDTPGKEEVTFKINDLVGVT